MATYERDVQIERLWKTYKSTGTLSVREELITEYLSLVKYIVGRISISMPSGVDPDDLLSYGILGLIDAIEKFDLSKGVKFETYASIRIKGAILEGLRSEDWAPRSVRRQAREIERAISSLNARLGRMPTDQEIAEEMGIDSIELANLFSRVNGATILSLEQPIADDSDEKVLCLQDAIADDSDREPHIIVESEFLYKALTAAIEELPEREQLVISLYYYEELTLKEISKVLGVSESRVSQIHTKVLMKLRAAIRWEA